MLLRQMRNGCVFLLPALLGCMHSAAQLYNNGGTITIANGATIVCGGKLNNTGTLTNNGTAKISGNILNNGTFSNAAGTTVHLQGTALQTITGVPLTVHNLVLNNPAGVTLNTELMLQGHVTFTSGNINTGVNDVAFASGSGIANTPTDASHIDGRVRFHGIGTFIMPVGNASRYQPIQVHLSTNIGGLVVYYNDADAGTASFSTAGSSATPLVSYNTKEYWHVDIADHASGSVTGSITLNWDGYKDAFSNPLTERKLAHKINYAWQNDGGNATGTESFGSLTSNDFSSWGAFTLGSISTPLPLRWLSLNGKLNNTKHATIQWKVSEWNTLQYVVEKSNNGREFTSIATIASNGNGTNVYQFTESSVLTGTEYYRIKQVNKSGEFNYSSVIKLSQGEATSKVAVSPSLVQASTTLNISVPYDKSLAYSIVSVDGKILMTRSILLNKGVNAIPLNVQHLVPGIYHVVMRNESEILPVSFIKIP